MVITVNDSAELIAALDAANGGERIELVAGEYDSVTLRGYDFNVPVTITSAETGSATVFGGRIAILESEGLKFENLKFQLADDEPVSWTGQFRLVDSKEISISNVALEGRIATADEAPLYEEVSRDNYAFRAVAEYPFGTGFEFSNSKDISMENVDISKLRIGISFKNVDGFDLTNSHIHDMRSDGLNISDSKDIRIADNLFDNFKPFLLDTDGAVGDHPDYIQYWGVNSTDGIHGMEISGNLFLQGGGEPPQAIYGRMNTSAVRDDGITFTDLSIHDNLINTAHPNAIYVSDWKDAEIYNNTLLPAPQTAGTLHRTGGLPRIYVTTDAKPLKGGGYDFDKGILPKNVRVEGNVIVGKKDGFGVEIGKLDAKEIAAQHVVVGENALLSAQQKSANFWGKFFPDQLNAPVSDVSGLSGLKIGGVTKIADWLVDAAAQIETVSPTDIIGGDGDDVLVSTGVGERLIGNDGDDLLIGGAKRDVLYGGAGDDTMTGGARGDSFSLTAPAKGGHAVDVITDLDFSAGDYILLGDGFPGKFFDDSLDAGNSMLTYASRSVAILSDDKDIDELLLSDRVSAVRTASGDLELQFDFDGHGSVDYVVRLVGYAKSGPDKTDATEGGPKVDFAAGQPVVDDRDANDSTGGAGDDVIPGAAAGESIVIPDFAAGEVILLDGFPPGYFAGVGLDAPSGVDDRSSVEISSLADLSLLASQGFVTAKLEADAVVDLRLDLSSGGAANSISLSIEGLELGDAYLVANGGTGAPTVQGGNGPDKLWGDQSDDVLLGGGGDDLLKGLEGDDLLVAGAGDDRLDAAAGSDVLIGGSGADWFNVFGYMQEAGDHDVVVDLDFEEGDYISFMGFGKGTFADGYHNGNSIRIRSIEELATLESPKFHFETDAANGVVLTMASSDGPSSIEFLLNSGDLARFEGLLSG